MGLDNIIKMLLSKEKFQIITRGSRLLLLHAITYWPEAITTMLRPYAMKDFTEQLNVLNVDDDGITTMEKFSGTTTEIIHKNHHT